MRQARGGQQRLPVIATLLVLVAVAVMISLGFWQLDRREQKAALLAGFAAAAHDEREVAWPDEDGAAEQILYRRSRLVCQEVTDRSAIAGQNAGGEPGFAHVATCHTALGVEAMVVLGWSREPLTPAWEGGEVRGVVAPGPRLIANPPQAGLQANAKPDPSDIPNNHLSYAVQWFFFAATALGVYALALRKRLAG